MDRRLSLAGTWTLTDGDAISVPAALPGDNYSALRDAGVIPDPYEGDNEHHVQWVRERTWTFARDVELSPEWAALPEATLRFQAVDTFAEIRLNGTLLGPENRSAMQTVVLDTNALLMPFEIKMNLDLALRELLGEVRVVVPGPLVGELKHLDHKFAGAALSLARKYEIIPTEASGDSSVIELAKKCGVYHGDL